MFVKILSNDGFADVRAPEICDFRGIRYNNYGYAVLVTSHRKHDYLIPMEREQYDIIATELAMHIAKGTRLVEISGGVVFRVKQGGMAQQPGHNTNKYTVTAINID